jgi:hypothetical protein
MTRSILVVAIGSVLSAGPVLAQAPVVGATNAEALFTRS